MKTFSQLIEQIGIDEATGDIWKNIQGLAQKGKGSTSFKFPGDSAKVVVTSSDASLLVGAYLGLNKSNQVKFVEMIETDGANYWAMVEWAKEMGVTHISVGESVESLEELNLDSLWQKFLKKIKMRPFDRKERARDKEEKKKIRKYQKMVGITSSVEHLDEKVYDPMYYDAGMNNLSGMNKFIDAMTKAKITVTSPRKGVAEVFPKQGSDRQKIFKAAERYGMIAVDESVEHLDEKVKGWIAIYNGKELEIPNDGKVKGILGAKQLAIQHFDIPMSKWGKLAISIAESVELDEATTWLKWDNKSQDGQSYGREMTLKILKVAGYPNVDKLKKKVAEEPSEGEEAFSYGETSE